MGGDLVEARVGALEKRAGLVVAELLATGLAGVLRVLVLDGVVVPGAFVHPMRVPMRLVTLRGRSWLLHGAGIGRTRCQGKHPGKQRHPREVAQAAAVEA
jgi:hypothetical protein